MIVQNNNVILNYIPEITVLFSVCQLSMSSGFRSHESGRLQTCPLPPGDHAVIMFSLLTTISKLFDCTTGPESEFYFISMFENAIL